MRYEDIILSNPTFFSNNNALLEVVTDKKVIEEWMIKKKEQLNVQNKPENWGEIGVVYEDPYIIILRDLVIFPDGKLGSYFRILNVADLQGGKGIVILPIIENKILLLQQFRHSTRNWHWEVPRGFGEPHMSPEDNAKKEIQEEIEGEIAELINLGPYHSNTGIEGVVVELFLAKLKQIGEPNRNEGILMFQLFDVKTIEEMIGKAEITDGFTIAAFTRARLRTLL